jgi:hypothetical protein
MNSRQRPQEEAAPAAAKEPAVMRFSLRFILCGLALCAGLLAPLKATADDAPKPRVKLYMASAERVLADLEWIIADLAKEKTQWDNNIFPSLDIFLFGVDRNLPIRFDAMIGGEDPGAVNPGAYRYAPCIPIDRDGKDLRTFIQQNLVPIGINVRQRSRGGYYSLNGVYDGWMRMVEEYACIGTYESDVPKDMPHPELSHQRLVEADYDLAVELENTAEQTQERAEAFAVFEQNLVDATKREEDESEAAFAMRKAAAEHNLERIGAVYRDAQRVTFGWITDVEKQSSRGDLYGAGLPDTDLAKLIDMLSVEHSRFSVLPMSEDPALGVQINFPFDDFLKEQLTESYELYRPVAHEKIDEAEMFTSEEKQPAKQVSDLLIDMLTEGIDVGRLDLYIDMTKAEGGPHVIVAGVRAADGKKADEIVKLIPQAFSDWKAELDIETVEETAIHKLDLSGDLPQALIDTFGDSGMIYIGTSADLVWIAGGEGSLDLLKETITKVHQDEPPAEISNVFGEFKVHVHTLLKLQDSLATEMGWSPFGSIELQPRRPAAGDGTALQPIDPAEIRGIATRATADIDDRMSGQVRRVDDHVEGEVDVAPGVLRALGKIVAKIAADNL